MYTAVNNMTSIKYVKDTNVDISVMFKKKDKKIQNKHPSLPVPGTSRDPGIIGTSENDPNVPEESWRKRCCNYMYDRENKLFCGRTCKSWAYILLYSIMYLVFLSTYTMIFLFGSLSVIKFLDDYQTIDKVELLTYSMNGIGLTAAPTALNNYPIIWYRNDSKEYTKYINGLEKLLSKRRKRDTKNSTYLGPCCSSPFGYGNSPCIIIRINKQRNWSAKPLKEDRAQKLNAPQTVKKWVKIDQKLWLYCEGIHSYDKEHIGKIKYYPDPPGFDPKLFPLNEHTDSPMIAVQIFNFTMGISLAIKCSLWYNEGVSTIEFMLYVTPTKIDNLRYL